MKRVLIFGFSVTADREGYAERVAEFAKEAPEAGIQVVVCGVGGVNPLPMAILYEIVASRSGPFDYVFLEFATSVYGTRISDWLREGIDPLFDIFERISVSGALFAFINLYRDDFNYNYHTFDMVVEALAARYNIPLLDLGAHLIRDKGADYCKSLLRDIVHTNQNGAKFQAERVWEFIRSVVRTGRSHSPTPVPQWRARAIDLVAKCKAGSDEFSRTGLNLTHGILPAGESCAVNVPDAAQLYGISFLSGPLSGDLELFLAGVEKKLIIPAYDANCYYIRYNFHRIGLVSGCTSVIISQNGAIVDIPLAKGKPNTSARIGNPIALHYYERAT